MPGKPVPDLTGQVFGKWTVLGRAPRPPWAGPTNRAVYYHCRCACGTLRPVQGRYLRDGRSTQCVYCRTKNHPWSRGRTDAPSKEQS